MYPLVLRKSNNLVIFSSYLSLQALFFADGRCKYPRSLSTCSNCRGCSGLLGGQACWGLSVPKKTALEQVFHGITCCGSKHLLKKNKEDLVSQLFDFFIFIYIIYIIIMIMIIIIITIIIYIYMTRLSRLSYRSFLYWVLLTFFFSSQGEIRCKAPAEGDSVLALCPEENVNPEQDGMYRLIPGVFLRSVVSISVRGPVSATCASKWCSVLNRPAIIRLSTALKLKHCSYRMVFVFLFVADYISMGTRALSSVIHVILRGFDSLLQAIKDTSLNLFFFSHTSGQFKVTSADLSSLYYCIEILWEGSCMTLTPNPGNFDKTSWLAR